MASRRRSLDFGTEGWQRLRGREGELFPRTVRPRALGLLWVVVAILAIALWAIAVAETPWLR